MWGRIVAKKYLIILRTGLLLGLCGVNTLLEKSEMEDTLIEASDIDPPVEISLNGDVIRIIKAFKNYVTLIGEPSFRWKQNEQK